MVFLDPNRLFTNESTVFSSGIKKADLSRTITVAKDQEGNHAVVDGNHRAKKALLEGRMIEAEIVMHLKKTLRQSAEFQLVSDLKIVDK